MIFVLESYRKNRKAKAEAWERAGHAWVARQGSYFSMRDYERTNPRPGVKVNGEKIAATITAMIISLTFVGIFVALIKNAPTGAEVDKSASNPHGCHVLVKKGDKVAVHDGDFDGSKGDVIDQQEDCTVHLTLTDSTYTLARCDKINHNYCEKAKENGSILTVDNSKNIIKL